MISVPVCQKPQGFLNKQTENILAVSEVKHLNLCTPLYNLPAIRLWQKSTIFLLFVQNHAVP